MKNYADLWTGYKARKSAGDIAVLKKFYLSGGAESAG